eukprot:5085186-Prymnesium_polylepis.1
MRIEPLVVEGIAIGIPVCEAEVSVYVRQEDFWRTSGGAARRAHVHFSDDVAYAFHSFATRSNSAMCWSFISDSALYLALAFVSSISAFLSAREFSFLCLELGLEALLHLALNQPELVGILLRDRFGRDRGRLRGRAPRGIAPRLESYTARP